MKPLNNDEAKFLLGVYRRGGEDAKDPRFEEALEQVQCDPALARWFAKEQELDAGLASKLRAAVRPPAGLTGLLLPTAK